MTAKYFAILTNYGAAQLANAVALGTKLNISVMAVGDGGGVLPIPDPAQTKLIRETRRAAVNQVSVDDKNPNYIISEQVIPENEGGWFIREIGLFDDKGGLIAVGNAPETYKPNLQEGSGRTQVIQMVLMVSSTESITLKVDPSVVLATREYVTKSIAAAIQESEAKAAKTYQPIGDYVLHSYLKLELLKKFDKANIAHQLGNDTDKTASLHLLTTELGKLQPKGNYALKSDSYLKTESDAKYQLRGDYALLSDLKSLIKPGFTMLTMLDEADIVPPWYSINGDRYGIDTPVGKVLRALSADFKERWNIIQTADTITLPKVLQPDGRMPFLRPVNGSGRIPGSVVGDTMRNFKGELGYENNYGLTTSERDVTGVFQAYGQSRGSFMGGGSGKTTNIMFDPSKVVPTGAEFKPLDVGVTWVIYIGV